MSLPLYQGNSANPPPQLAHQPQVYNRNSSGPQYQVLRTPKGLYVREVPQTTGTPPSSTLSNKRYIPPPSKGLRSKHGYQTTALSPIDGAPEDARTPGRESDGHSSESERSSADGVSFTTASTRESTIPYPPTPDSNDIALGITGISPLKKKGISQAKVRRSVSPLPSIGYGPSWSPRKVPQRRGATSPGSSPKKGKDSKKRGSYSAFPAASGGSHPDSSKSNKAPGSSDGKSKPQQSASRGLDLGGRTSESEHELGSGKQKRAQAKRAEKERKAEEKERKAEEKERKAEEKEKKAEEKRASATSRDSGSSILGPMSEASAAAVNIFARAIKRSQDQWTPSLPTVQSEAASDGKSQHQSTEKPEKSSRPNSWRLSRGSSNGATPRLSRDFPTPPPLPGVNDASNQSQSPSDPPPKSPLRRTGTRSSDSLFSRRDGQSPTKVSGVSTIRKIGSSDTLGAGTSSLETMSSSSRPRARSRGMSEVSKPLETVAEKRSSQGSQLSLQTSAYNNAPLPPLPAASKREKFPLTIDTRMTGALTSPTRSSPPTTVHDPEQKRRSSLALPSPPPIRQKEFAAPTIRVIAVQEHDAYTPIGPSRSRDGKPGTAGRDSKRTSGGSFFADGLPEWARIFYGRPISIVSIPKRQDSIATTECIFRQSTFGMPKKKRSRMSGLAMHPIREMPSVRGYRRVRSPQDRTARQSAHLWHNCKDLRSCDHPDIRTKVSKERNVQILLFLAGFLFPPAWFCAAVIPLPEMSKPKEGVREKTMSYLQLDSPDVEQQQSPMDKVLESARWWRMTNRIMCFTGAAVIICVIILTVTATT